MRWAKLSMIAGGFFLLLSAIAYALADAWYHDDACTIEEHKCELGALGFSALFFTLPLALVLLAAGAVAALVLGRRRR